MIFNISQTFYQLNISQAARASDMDTVQISAFSKKIAVCSWLSGVKMPHYSGCRAALRVLPAGTRLTVHRGREIYGGARLQLKISLDLCVRSG